MSDKERISFGDWCDMKGILPTMGQVDAYVRELFAAECTAPAPQPNQLAEALADLLQSMEGFRQGALSPGKLRIAMQKANDLLQPDLDEKNDLDTLRERDQRFDNSEEVKELRELNYRLQQLLSKREATPQVTPTPDFPAILERERTLVAEGVTNVKKAIQCREWLTEGRGSYEWNDDRWHGEFAAAISEILTAIQPLERIAADWTNCPQKWEDAQKAREELKGKPWNEGTSEQASPTPDHQRVGESAGEWIARCGMETVDRILTEERRKYGVGEVERG